jgi:hypothetical protein
VSFGASFVPFIFGLVLLGAGAVLHGMYKLFGLALLSDWDRESGDVAYNSFRPAQTPYTTTDRIYDFCCDRGDVMKSFFAHPRGLMTFCDGLCDRGQALLRKRSPR